MPKLATPLTDTRIKGLKPKPKRYLVADGGGLVLEVMTSGTKVWRYRYSLNGKQQPLVTIGDYPAIGLQDARERARRYVEIVAKGVSPVADAKRDRGAVKVLDAVRQFGEHWYTAEMTDKSESYAKTTRRALDKDIYPAIGNKKMSDVTAGDVLAICDRIKGRGSPQSALFARNVLKRMYQYAIARQVVTNNPAHQLAPRFIATAKSRTRVLSADEIGVFLRAVYASDMARSLKLALHLLTITMVRKSELMEAEWHEFDLNEAIWRIPGKRMKMDKDHWVLLSTQAIAMLKELQTFSHRAVHVFPKRRGSGTGPVSKTTLNAAVRAMDIEMQHFVIHDLRRTASTHLHEMGQMTDAVETALSHSVSGIRGIYNRAQYLGERRKILQLWADFVDAQIEGRHRVVVGYFGQTA